MALSARARHFGTNRQTKSYWETLVQSNTAGILKSIVLGRYSTSFDEFHIKITIDGQIFFEGYVYRLAEAFGRGEIVRADKQTTNEFHIPTLPFIEGLHGAGHRQFIWSEANLPFAQSLKIEIKGNIAFNGSIVYFEEK